MLQYWYSGGRQALIAVVQIRYRLPRRLLKYSYANHVFHAQAVCRPY